MMHQKNCFAALTALLLAFALCACSSKPVDDSPTEPVTDPGVTETPPPVEETTEDDTTSDMPSLEAVSDMPAALMHTVLSGVNGKDGAFAVRFTETEAEFCSAQSGSTEKGYWTLDGGMLHIYSDEAKASEQHAIQFDYNKVKNVLRLDGNVYMADTGTDSLDDEGAKLSGAAEAYAQLRDAYWGGGDSAYALIFKLSDDGSCDMHYYDGSDGIIDEATFFWAMGGDTIFFYNEDFAPVMHFYWRMDGPAFTLSDTETGNTIPCTALTEEQSSEVSRQLGVMAGAYESEGDGSVDIDYGNYQDFDVSVD